MVKYSCEKCNIDFQKEHANLLAICPICGINVQEAKIKQQEEAVTEEQKFFNPGFFDDDSWDDSCDVKTTSIFDCALGKVVDLKYSLKYNAYWIEYD